MVEEEENTSLTQVCNCTALERGRGAYKGTRLEPAGIVLVYKGRL